MLSIVQHNCQKTEFHSFQEEEIGKLLPKNLERTAGRQLDGHHQLFGEYLQ